ncbi:substrate-binding domain-containing protein [Chamaesiphon sp. VAR_48_metabat_135_sub]|uniref:substrate-binding domain-containing protein n=1 Tax=Chamaesiphon sp. VAR_48_metabat_135_sub TaxID=2964699 RepID=UPI00286B5E5A|nr:substrate-binding domain-containing protein [Chamaesiphon sp. VAR_48_metabat_135_sub]
MTAQKLIVFSIGALMLLPLASCTQTNSAQLTATTSTPVSIKIGGSSSTVGLLTLLETNYSAINKNVKITQIKPGQSESIIEGIKLKVVDVGTIAKSAKVGKNDSILNSREIVHDLLLVATHPSVTGVKNLTTKNLQDIYSGTISNWQQIGGPNAKIVLLDRPDDESAKQILRKYYLGKDLKNSPQAVVFRKEGELIQAIQSTPYSIGAFSLAHAVSHQLPVNRLSLNGFAPTAANLNTHKYPMVRHLTVVWHQNPSAATQSFIQYIFSPPATSAMERAGFIPVSESIEH